MQTLTLHRVSHISHGKFNFDISLLANVPNQQMCHTSIIRISVCAERSGKKKLKCTDTPCTGSNHNCHTKFVTIFNFKRMPTQLRFVHWDIHFQLFLACLWIDTKIYAARQINSPTFEISLQCIDPPRYCFHLRFGILYFANVWPFWHVTVEQIEQKSPKHFPQKNNNAFDTCFNLIPLLIHKMPHEKYVRKLSWFFFFCFMNVGCYFGISTCNAARQKTTTNDIKLEFNNTHRNIMCWFKLLSIRFHLGQGKTNIDNMNDFWKLLNG